MTTLQLGETEVLACERRVSSGQYESSTGQAKSRLRARQSSSLSFLDSFSSLETQVDSNFVHLGDYR